MLENEFKYGEILSSSFGILCEQETHSILPSMRRCEQEIIGVDGVIDYGIGGYGTRIITLPIYYKGTFKELRQNREQIISWLSGDGKPKKLILGKEPDKYYMAKIYSEVNFENADSRHIGDIEFECNPPWQYLLNGTLLTPEQLIYINCNRDINQYIKEFTANGSIKLINKGQAVKPIIKLIGYIKSGITLTCGTSSLKLNADTILDGIVIDCANETVKRMSDNTSLYSIIDGTKNNFFQLAHGNCEISLSMTGIGSYPKSVTMIVEFESAVA